MTSSSTSEMESSTLIHGPQEKESNDEDSADEALCEMLGLASLSDAKIEDHEHEHEQPQSGKNDIPRLPQSDIDNLSKLNHLQSLFETTSMCVLPRDLSIPVSFIRRITDELIWASDKFVSDRTYETIRIWKPSTGETEDRRVLTRLENFVDHHEGWNELCNDYLRRCISSVMGVDMALYKEKLNLKPPGGTGFAPHLDTPSLRIALGDSGPQTFVTVMVAIDDMTSQNGCLRIHKGNWSEDYHCQLVPPEEDGNPDAGGRAGAIPQDVAESMDFEDILCRGGDVVAFNGYAPHRSSANKSPFPRRAVFLTYNPRSEGDCHDQYYKRMAKLRDDWKTSVGLTNNVISADEQAELDALATIPSI